MKQNIFLDHFSFPIELIKKLKNLQLSLNFAELQLPKDTVYLDFAASTPLDIRVFESMLPWYFNYFASTSSRLHSMGAISEQALSQARMTIADLFHHEFENVIFTSCATECNNLVLRGLIENPFRKRNKILYGTTEHSSIIETAKHLVALHPNLILVPLAVDNYGQIDLTIAQEEIDTNTLCVCVMDVNNETGLIQKNLSKIEQLVHANGSHLHIDCAQSLARIPKIADGIPYDTATISSAKIYGPKGSAALLIRKKRPHIRLEAQMTGGNHEFSFRSGSVNLPAIIGFTKACILQQEEQFERFSWYQYLETIFCDIMQQDSFVHIFQGNLPEQKAAGILTLNINGVNAMKLIEESKNICVSTGSSCKSSQNTASHVLLAMGVEYEKAFSSFRVSFGLTNTEDEVKLAAYKLLSVAKNIRF